MRRKDRQMTEEDSVGLLKAGNYGILSTVNSDNSAYGIPLSYVYVDGLIYLHCALEGRKIDNIIYNPKICFTVVSDVEPLPSAFSTKYKSVVVFGELIIIEDLEEKRKGLTEILKKYSQNYMDSGLRHIEDALDSVKVLKIEPLHITGKMRL